MDEIAAIIENQPGDAAHSGRRFYCRLIPVGAGYGLDDAIINDRREVMVEMWDMEHMHHPQRGQFTGARYYVWTLLDGDSPNRGLDLVGYEPAWKMDAPAYRELIDWLKEVAA